MSEIKQWFITYEQLHLSRTSIVLLFGKFEVALSIYLDIYCKGTKEPIVHLYIYVPYFAWQPKDQKRNPS